MTVQVNYRGTNIEHVARAGFPSRRVAGLRYCDRGDEVEAFGLRAEWEHDPESPTTWRLARAFLDYRRIKRDGNPYATPNKDMLAVADYETFRDVLTAMWPTVRIAIHEGS